jgi:hypothetical protein
MNSKVKQFLIGQVGFTLGTVGLIIFTDMETSEIVRNHFIISLGYIAALYPKQVKVEH